MQIDRIPEESEERVFGPWRVKPGGLSVDTFKQVSRTFGDIESKRKEFGGMPGVVTAEPEITIFGHSQDLDYVFLACDGIFDALTNEEVNCMIWETIEYHKQQASSFQQCLNDCVNNVLKKAMIQNSEDNVTAILVAFRNLLC